MQSEYLPNRSTDPFQSVGLVEYGVFARGIDERIACECLSCFPNAVDSTCNCAWRFTLGR